MRGPQLVRVDATILDATVILSTALPPRTSRSSTAALAGRFLSSSRTFPYVDRRELDLTVPLTNLTAGPCLLRVSATDGTHTVQREIGILVR